MSRQEVRGQRSRWAAPVAAELGHGCAGCPGLGTTDTELGWVGGFSNVFLVGSAIMCKTFLETPSTAAHSDVRGKSLACLWSSTGNAVFVAPFQRLL